MSKDERFEVWYVRGPDDGIEEYRTAAEAKHAAEALLESYEDSAASDGWPSDIDCLEWGKLCPVESASVEVRPAPEGSSFDEHWDVSLKAIESGELGKAEVTIANLRARLELFREHVCGDCKCAPKAASYGRCWDCYIYHYSRAWTPDWTTGAENYAASHISVGMRALCGRRVFE